MTESVYAINRGRLTLRFEELLKTSGSNEQFLRDIAAHCHASADSPWEALAAIDQLYRRGKLSPQLFRAARIGIERRALGVHESSPQSEPWRHTATALRSVALQPQPAPTSSVSTPSSEPLLETELQRLRGELEQARREAADYRQRLDRVQTLDTIDVAETVAAVAVVAPALAPSLAPPPLPVPVPVPAPSRIAAPVRITAARSVATSAVVGSLPLRWAMRLLVVAAALGLLAGLPSTRLPAAVAAQAVSVAPAPPLVTPVTPRVTRPGELALASDRYVFSRGDRRALIEVRRTGGSDGAISLSWRIAAASARQGRDFSGALHGTVTLADGQGSAQIVVPLLRNSERRHTEFFDLRLVAREGVALGALRRTTVFLMPEAQAIARNAR